MDVSNEKISVSVFFSKYIFSVVSFIFGHLFMNYSSKVSSKK